MDLLHINETRILIYNYTVQKNIAGIQVNLNKTCGGILLASPKAARTQRLKFGTNNHAS